LIELRKNNLKSKVTSLWAESQLKFDAEGHPNPLKCPQMRKNGIIRQHFEEATTGI
jgi:hypothetical protein